MLELHLADGHRIAVLKAWVEYFTDDPTLVAQRSDHELAKTIVCLSGDAIFVVREAYEQIWEAMSHK